MFGPSSIGVFTVQPPSDAYPDARIRHPHHRTFWTAIVGYWLLGLVAGFVCTLGVAARFGCEPGATGLACHNTGSALGLVLVLGVIIDVGVATVFAFEARERIRTWSAYLGLGLVVMVVLVVAARLLSSTL